MDDLTQLDGIGPRRAEALADVAITTFDLLAAMAPATSLLSIFFEVAQPHYYDATFKAVLDAAEIRT